MSTQKPSQEQAVLGAGMSNVRRALAFLSIVVIYFFYCYNFMVGTFVTPTMIAPLAEGGFGFTLENTAEIFAVMSFGTIPGTIIFGMLSAKIGKKRTLMIVASLIALTTFVPMLAPTNVTVWQVARLLTGVTLGGVFGSAMPLIADMFPSKYRGKLAATLTALFSLAMIFGGQMYALLGDANWSILMYTAIIPPIVGAVMTFFFVPDDYEMTVNMVSESGKKEKISYLSMYKGKYILIGLGVILLSGANFTAYSSFSNYATTYLTTGLGMTAVVAGSIYSLQGIGQLVGYLTWGAIADKFGRKIPAIGMLLSAGLIFLYMQQGADSVLSLQIISVGLGFCFGYSGPWGAYYTELFPSKFRSISAGISFNGGRIISTFALPAAAGLVTETSGMTPIFTVAMVVFAAGTVVWLLLPETLDRKGKKAAAAQANQTAQTEQE